jgi:hypothetical protein
MLDDGERMPMRLETVVSEGALSMPPRKRI